MLEAELAARPPRPPAEAARRAAAITRLLRLYGGGSLSVITVVNPEFEWWIPHLDAPEAGLEDEGAVAFCWAAGYGRRVAMVVGDPLAPRSAWAALVAAFVRPTRPPSFGMRPPSLRPS